MLQPRIVQQRGQSVLYGIAGLGSQCLINIWGHPLLFYWGGAGPLPPFGAGSGFRVEGKVWWGEGRDIMWVSNLPKVTLSDKVSLPGFEPGTFGLRSRCSDHYSLHQHASQTNTPQKWTCLTKYIYDKLKWLIICYASLSSTLSPDWSGESGVNLRRNVKFVYSRTSNSTYFLCDKYIVFAGFRGLKLWITKIWLAKNN